MSLLEFIHEIEQLELRAIETLPPEGFDRFAIIHGVVNLGVDVRILKDRLAEHVSQIADED